MENLQKTIINKESSWNNFLLVLLVLTSFFSGYLYLKVKILEGKQTTGIVAGQQQIQVIQPSPTLLPEPSFKLSNMPSIDKKDHIRGNIEASVILVEYSDLECPFCKQFHPTMQQVLKEYGKKVAWVYRHYPLSFHPKAQKSAEATECANELGGNSAFWKMTDLIFEKMPDLTLEELPQLANKIGLNQASFEKCLESGKYEQRVKDDMDGGSQAGISGTPGTILVAKNGKRDLVSGALSFEKIKQQIDKLLE
jgi:protein-disulfide isomerase